MARVPTPLVCVQGQTYRHKIKNNLIVTLLAEMKRDTSFARLFYSWFKPIWILRVRTWFGLNVNDPLKNGADVELARRLQVDVVVCFFSKCQRQIRV